MDKDERARRVARGKKAAELLEEYGRDFLAEKERQTLDALYRATPDRLLGIWADYKAARSLISRMESEVNTGKRNAKAIYEEQVGGDSNV